MAEVGFYHLTRSTLPQVLPQLLGRTLNAGQRAFILGREQASLDLLSTALWEQPAWLPHGGDADGDADLQPIWLSTVDNPANGARFLFLVEGATTGQLGNFDRVFDIFDGGCDDSVAAARQRWIAARDAGHVVTYWHQTDSGWLKKA